MDDDDYDVDLNNDDDDDDDDDDADAPHNPFFPLSPVSHRSISSIAVALAHASSLVCRSLLSNSYMVHDGDDDDDDDDDDIDDNID